MLFAVLWRDEQGAEHVDLAAVDIVSGEIKRLGLDPLPVYSLDLDASPNGEWVILAETSALNESVCLLVNLDRKDLECLSLGKGHYLSAKFVNDSLVTYVHRLGNSVGVYVLDINGNESKPLVLGLNAARILLVVGKTILFRGATFDN